MSRSRKRKRVALAAGEVGRVREQPMVGRDLEAAEREVVVTGRERRSRRAGSARRRRARGPPAVDRVLLALDACASSSSTRRRGSGADSSVSCTRDADLVVDALAEIGAPARARLRRRRSRPRGRRGPPGSSRLRSQYQSSTRSSPWIESICGRRGACGGVGWSHPGEPKRTVGREGARYDSALDAGTHHHPDSVHAPRSSTPSPTTPTASCPRSCRRRAPTRC